MNIQELIENIRNIDVVESFMSETIWVKRNDVLALVYQLDEPEKPVVPQFVADWYESIKDDFEDGVYELCIQLYNCDLDGRINFWFGCNDNKPIETLVKMKLYGYEVEKEKLYTVKFVTEDFGKIYIGFFKNFKKLGITSLVSNDDELRTHFNEEELKRFKFWDNPAFEIKEVGE